MIRAAALALLLSPLVSVPAFHAAHSMPQPADNPACVATPRADDWWTRRHEAFNARARQAAERGDIDILFLGDSITQGWEQNGLETWNQRYANRKAVNFGIGGDRTQHLLWRIQNGNLDGLAAPAAGSPPKAAVILIGTNNSNNDDHSAPEIADAVRAIVLAVRAKLPDTHIILMGIFPRGSQPDPQREKIAAVNRLLADIDLPNLHLLDLADNFIQPDGSIPRELMPDSLHLSPKGYQVWSDAIEPVLAKCLAGE